jgi:ABC-type multidrug transport system fused ATPase/permease subunit
MIIGLTALSTAASLVEPLIYRVAVNDVAGLFVGKAQQEAADLDVETALADTPQSVKAEFLTVAYQTRAYQTRERHELPRHRPAPKIKHPERYSEPHRRGQVSPRTPAQTLNTFIWAVLLLFLLSVFSRLLWLVADNMSARVASRIESSFIQRVFGHVLRLPLSFFAKRGSGAMAKQIDQADQVSPIVNGFTQTVLPECMTIAGAFIIMVTQNWVMTLIALVTLPLYFVIAWRSAKRLENGLEDYYAQWEDVSGRIQDSVSAIKTVKLSGAEAREIEKFRETSGAAYETYIRRTRLENKFTFWEHAITQLGQAMVLGVGGWFALQHQLTPGDVVMFVSYVGMLYDPIDSLTGLAIELQQHGIALRRALRLTQTAMEPQTGESAKTGKGQIEFRDVHFSYTPDREALRGLSLTIKPGQLVALVGPSGAGKTTTVDLLMRLYEPSSGVILLDGQNLSDLNAASVRRAIGVVAAEGTVFRGTLADNIRYERPEATDQEVHEAALAAGLGVALDRLPGGLQTRVGEGGIGLSVGERQRLQLARVLAANPDIMVLDEATANLDYNTEVEVKRALGTLRKDKTTIVIAHRFSMVKHAAYVYVIEAGRVIEAGTPEELTASRGWFAAFAASGAGTEDTVYETDDDEED